MYVIMGGTGHVGAATAAALLARGESVAIITRDVSLAGEWLRKDVKLLEADVNDVASLRAAFQQGRRALLLNPPADTSSDTNSVELRTVANILAALEGSGLEKVVAASTGGAQRGSRIGDLSVLWELEEGLRRQKIPAAINRGAYYMSNWDSQLDATDETHKLQTLFPADLPIPMVAPLDLGRAAAERLVSDLHDVGIRYVEGPRRYSPREVAGVLSHMLGIRVDVQVTPRDQFKEAFRSLGFSESAADAYARMTQVSIDGGFDRPGNALRGSTTLEDYLGGQLASIRGHSGGSTRTGA